MIRTLASASLVLALAVSPVRYAQAALGVQAAPAVPSPSSSSGAAPASASSTPTGADPSAPAVAPAPGAGPNTPVAGTVPPPADPNAAPAGPSDPAAPMGADPTAAPEGVASGVDGPNADGFVNQVGFTAPEPLPPAEVLPAAAPAAALDADRPEEPRIGGRPAKGKGLLIAGATLIPLGIAWAITTALVTERCSLDGPLACKYDNQAHVLVPIGAGVAVAGVIVMGVGFGQRAKYRRWERWIPGQQAVLAPAVFRSGGGASYAVRF